MDSLSNTVSGNIASFKSASVAPIESLKVYFNPVLEGTGDPSSENIRPIEGWDNINLILTGKNLFNCKNPNIVDKCWMNTTIIAGSSTDRVIYIPCLPNTTYTVSKTIGDVLAIGYTIVLPEKGISHYGYLRDSHARKLTITTGEDAKYLVAWVYDASKTFDKTVLPEDIYKTILIEYGQKNTQLEHYQESVLTIDWSNDIGTIYGGYVDLITGELVLEWNKIIVDGTNIKINSNYSDANYICGGLVYLLPYGLNDGYSISSTVLCNNMKVYAAGNTITTIPSVKTISAGKLYLRFYLANASEHPELDTKEKVIEFCNNYFIEHPTQIVYKLDTPITYQLSPHQLKTLLGQNNIWSNTNDITEVTYQVQTSSIMLALHKKIIDAMAPHIAIASGNIANFNTDIVGKLKSCKMYFSPTLAGSGDPSPENVREINGWTNFNILKTKKNILNPLTNPIWNNNTYTILSDGGITVSGSDGRGWTSSLITPLQLKKGTYTFTWIGSKRVLFATSEDNYTNVTVYSANNLTSYKNFTFTLSTDGAIKWKHTSDSSDYPLTVYVLIEPVNIGSAYELYNGSIISIDWTNILGTLYGGYIDIITGQLIGTYLYITVDENSNIYTYGNANYSGTYACNRCVSLPFNSIITHPMHQLTYIMYGDKINCYHKNYSWGDPDNHIWQACINAKTLLHISFANSATGVDMTTDTYALSVTKIKNWLANNNLHFAIPLETPILIGTLTPTQLKSLKGTNNIWSNTNGPVEVQYYTH